LLLPAVLYRGAVSSRIRGAKKRKIERSPFFFSFF
jgi:hypothetical protein